MNPKRPSIKQLEYFLTVARASSFRGAAEQLGMVAVRIHSPQIPEQSINSADWMILSRNETLLEQLRPFARQQAAPPKPSVLWTDQRSSLFEVLK